MMQKSLPAARVGLSDECHQLSAGGCIRNEVIATGEAGAMAPGSKHHGCPHPRSTCQGADPWYCAREVQGGLGTDQSPYTHGLCITQLEDAAAMLVVTEMLGKCF